MGNEMVGYQQASLSDRMQYANTLAAAGQLIPKGLFDPATGKPSAPKILLVMETGSMLGMHPMAALQSIDVVEGRATLSAKLMGGLLMDRGHKLVIEKSGSIPTGDYSVTAIATRGDNGAEFRETWDIPRAVRAGLVTSYKQNAQGVWEVRARTDRGAIKPWEAYAETMPMWRAISGVSRVGFADVLFGLYSTEEMTDGGFPPSEPEVFPEQSEDWAALIEAAESRGELDEIASRLKANDEGTDKIRTAWLARAGVLSREENIEDAVLVEDEPVQAPPAESEAEYEARMAAEYDAAVDAGEVSS